MMNDLFTPRDAVNVRRFNLWMIVTALFFAAGTIVLGEGFIPRVPVAWLFPFVGAVLGFGALRAYVHFLRNADELLRKIHLDALALGFGSGVIFMPVYRLCERLGAPKLDSVDPIIIFVLAWAIGQWRGFRRYSAVEAQ